MTLITTRFDKQTTADEVVTGVDLTGPRAVVTVASSRIGVETARSLARGGAQVTLAVRHAAAGQRVAADLTATTGNPDVRVAPLELADRASVAAVVAAEVPPIGGGVRQYAVEPQTAGQLWDTSLALLETASPHRS